MAMVSAVIGLFPVEVSGIKFVRKSGDLIIIKLNLGFVGIDDLILFGYQE